MSFRPEQMERAVRELSVSRNPFNGIPTANELVLYLTLLGTLGRANARACWTWQDAVRDWIRVRWARLLRVT